MPPISSQLCRAFLFAALVGCASSGDETASAPTLVGGKADAISGLSTCSGLPAGFGNPSFLAYGTATGTVYVPTNVTAKSEIWIVFGSSLPTYYGAQGASLHYSLDNWKTVKDTALTAWCNITDSHGDITPLYGMSLGELATGTKMVFDIHQQTPSDYYLKDPWINNGGKNYAFSIAAAASLSWVGDGQLGFGGVALDARSVPIDQPLTISAQTYPAGAGTKLAINWVDSAGKSGSAPLTFVSTGAGASGNNDLWTATLPASLDGGAFSYSISATDATGATVRDVAAGHETKVTPIAYPVSWAGSLGTLYTGDGENDYNIGQQFAADGSTTFGCNTEGADSLYERAVQVYVPGVTDRTFASASQAAAFAGLLTAEVYTNATKSGFGTIPMQFAEQLGHNFVFTFFNYADMCPVGPPQTAITDGTYAYKLKFSTDGGATFYSVGSSAGGDGGNNLVFKFAVAGLY